MSGIGNDEVACTFSDSTTFVYGTWRQSGAAAPGLGHIILVTAADHSIVNVTLFQSIESDARAADGSRRQKK